MTNAGTSVDTKAEPDVEPPLIPSVDRTSLLEDVALFRDDPMFGSLFGSYA